MHGWTTIKTRERNSFNKKKLFPEKPIIPLLIQILPAFYVNWNFISCSQNSLSNLQFHAGFFEIHFLYYTRTPYYGLVYQQ
jgi:hypothetical protein